MSISQQHVRSFCSYRCSQSIFPTTAGWKGWKHPKPPPSPYFCINTSCTHVPTRQVHTCPRTPQCLALVWFITNRLAIVWGVSCGSSSWGAQTRGSFQRSLPGSRAGSCHFKGSSPVQTPGYKHHIPWALVMVHRGLACVHTSSMKVNKCIKALPLGLEWTYPNRKIHLPWERRHCRTAAKPRLSFRGGTVCHCQTLPAEQTCGKAGPEAAHALQLQPSPASTEVELWATHRTLPEEIPTGPNQRRKGYFCSIFPILFIVQRQHGTLAPWNHHLHPELFSLFPLSPISISLYSFHCGPLNLSWTNTQQKIETWISYEVDVVPQIYFFYCKSTITEDPGAKSSWEILCNLL